MKSNVFIQAFGEFDVFAGGQKVIFHNSKSKELLALLADKYGLSLSRTELFSILWEDQIYDRIMQQRLNAVIRSMRSTLAGYGIDSIFEMKKGYLRIRPEYAVCDYWQFLKGDPEVVRSFSGKYMRPYAWGEIKGEYLKDKKSKWVLKPCAGERKAPVPAKGTDRLVEVRTFGGFDVMINGEFVAFERAKSKELLAYLIEREGKSVSRQEAGSILWEEKYFDRAMQKQLDVVVRSLSSTLCEYGISDIIEIHKEMRVVPAHFTCDLYRYLDREDAAMNEYCGEYMSCYTWAMPTEAYLDRIYRQVKFQSLGNRRE